MGLFIAHSVSFNKATPDMKEAHFLGCSSSSSSISPPPFPTPLASFPSENAGETPEPGLSHNVDKVRWISVRTVGRRHCN